MIIAYLTDEAIIEQSRGRHQLLRHGRDKSRARTSDLIKDTHQLLREGRYQWAIDAYPPVFRLRARTLTSAEIERDRELMRELMGLTG